MRLGRRPWASGAVGAALAIGATIYSGFPVDVCIFVLKVHDSHKSHLMINAGLIIACLMLDDDVPKSSLLLQTSHAKQVASGAALPYKHPRAESMDGAGSSAMIGRKPPHQHAQAEAGSQAMLEKRIGQRLAGVEKLRQQKQQAAKAFAKKVDGETAQYAKQFLQASLISMRFLILLRGSLCVHS